MCVFEQCLGNVFGQRLYPYLSCRFGRPLTHVMILIFELGSEYLFLSVNTQFGFWKLGNCLGTDAGVSMLEGF